MVIDLMKGSHLSADTREHIPETSNSSSCRDLDVNTCATVSLAQAARVLGIHRSTAWDLHKRGEFPIPVLRVGHRLRVTKVQLERFLAQENLP